jgi:hypothetical protein
VTVGGKPERGKAMTENDWLSCADTDLMLVYLEALPAFTGRKARLFAVACCRRYWDRLDERCRGTIEVAERFADRRANTQELLDAWQGLSGVKKHVERAAWSSAWPVNNGMADASAHCAASWASAFTSWMMAGTAHKNSGCPAPKSCHLDDQSPAWKSGYAAEQAAQAAVLRDLLGNPFHPVVADDSWRTPDVVTLAGHIYHDRAADLMPELADTLEDAGCQDADLLTHLRGPGPHARGCWAMDALLGKS